MAIPTLDDVPYNLMPVAALLGYAFFAAAFRAIYLLLVVAGRNSDDDDYGDSRTSSKKTSGGGGSSKNNVPFYAFVSFGALISYSYAVGRIEGAFVKAAHASFDPYAVLELDPSVNSTVLTAAYRTQVQYYHPSNAETGDAIKLRRVLLAYQALTEEDQKRNFERHGHPEGPVLTGTFQLAVPAWLYYGAFEDRVKESMLAAHVVAALTILGAVISLRLESRRRDAAAAIAAADEERDDEDDYDLQSQSVRDVDLQYFAERARPDMSHWDVLLLVVAAPTNVMWCTKDLQKIDQIRQERLEERDKQSARSSLMDFDSILDEGGWAEDDDEDDDGGGGDDGEAKKRAAAAAAKKDDEEKRKQLEQLRAATGTATRLLEDLDGDKGVLGQRWVERTLEKAGQWPPPDLGFLEKNVMPTLEVKGQRIGVSSPLEYPPLRRMLCMLSGRINSGMLNGHPELLEAGSQKLIDQTYFAANMTFRQRMGLLLEALIQIAMSLRSYRLMDTALTAATVFKIGCHADATQWFHEVMRRTYGIQPTINVTNESLQTPDQDEIATGDEVLMEFECERPHAENFLRQKIAMYQKQGIPPQVGLQSYREVWWLLLRCERLDDGKGMKPISLDATKLTQLKLTPPMLKVFEEEDPSNELVAAFPMVVNNVSQKTLKATVKFDVPAEAGKYRFTALLKSHDFLASGVEFSVEADVLDAAKVKRTATKKKKEGDDASAEPKKDK